MASHYCVTKTESFTGSSKNVEEYNSIKINHGGSLNDSFNVRNISVIIDEAIVTGRGTCNTQYPR